MLGCKAMHPDFPKLLNSSDTAVHREWILSHSIKELDEYLVRFGHIDEFYRMATAQRERLHFDLLGKRHRLNWWILGVATLTFVVCVIGYWDQIVRLLRWLGLWR